MGSVVETPTPPGEENRNGNTAFETDHMEANLDFGDTGASMA